MLMYQQTPPQALPNKRVLKYQQKPEGTSRNSVENVDVSTNSTSSFTKLGSVDISTKTRVNIKKFSGKC